MHASPAPPSRLGISLGLCLFSGLTPLSPTLFPCEPSTVNKTDHSFPQRLVWSRLPVNVGDFGTRSTGAESGPSEGVTKVLLLHLVHSAAGNLEPRPFTQETCGCRKEKGGETGRLGLSSLRDGVPTLYVLREDPLSCCSPDRRGAMGEQERIRRERSSVAACRLSLLRPAGWVVAPQHVGSCFPDQRSDLHPCVGRGPLTTGPPGNPSAAFCLFFQQCSRFPGWSVRCRMSFEMNSAAGMPRHP